LFGFFFPAFQFTVFHVPASNPYNPFGETVGVAGLLPVPGSIDNDTGFFRSLAGAKGNLFNSWHWEVTGWDSMDRSHSNSSGNENLGQFKERSIQQTLQPH